ncbi:MAG: dolichyl-phosphate beta-glucosyltransferase [Rhodospirillales bacterium]
MSRPKLSVVIPAYNEQDLIGATLESVVNFAGRHGLTMEILLVDDGSTDDTVERALRVDTGPVALRCLRGETNRGKGFAVRRGMLEAAGECVLFTDADLSTPIGEAERFLEAIEAGHPVAIGSRRLAAARITTRQPLLRQALGRVFSWLARRLLNDDVSDFTCGFKAFAHDVIPALFAPLTEEGWTFDAELLHIAQRRAIPVHEIAVQWANRANTRVRLLRDVLASAWGLGRIVVNGWRGRYDPPAGGGDGPGRTRSR